MNKELCIPNLGSTTAVDVVEILVKVGDRIAIDAPLCVVESDKSSFDIVSQYAGVIIALSLTIGSKIHSGHSFGSIALEEEVPAHTLKDMTEQPVANKAPVSLSAPIRSESIAAQSPQTSSSTMPFHAPQGQDWAVLYASPLVRKLARLQKYNLQNIQGTGDYGRITIGDLRAHQNSKTECDVPALESLPDYPLWGTLKIEKLSRVKTVAAQRFQRSWSVIPHVTHFDIACIDALEAFRVSINKEQAGQDHYVKLTFLSFIMKALAATLRDHPWFNSSLSSCGQHLCMKEHIHLGCAVETAKGLLVPVLHHVDRLSVCDIKMQLADLAMRARAFQLKPADYQGQTFTVSSLGSHGGRFFTPIIQWPDVAILGICKAYAEPCIKNGVLSQRLCLPLNLSYDHRVIDGGQAARFTQSLIQYLENPANCVL